MDHFEICSEYMRLQSPDEREKQYDIACAEWTKNPLYVAPPLGDKEASDGFFQAYHKVITSGPTCIQEYISDCMITGYHSQMKFDSQVVRCPIDLRRSIKGHLGATPYR